MIPPSPIRKQCRPAVGRSRPGSEPTRPGESLTLGISLQVEAADDTRVGGRPSLACRSASPPAWRCPCLASGCSSCSRATDLQRLQTRRWIRPSRRLPIGMAVPRPRCEAGARPAASRAPTNCTTASGGSRGPRSRPSRHRSVGGSARLAEEAPPCDPCLTGDTFPEEFLMIPRKRKSRIYWRDQGGASRAWFDGRDYRDVGG
jgi:hypothetical protein